MQEIVDLSYNINAGKFQFDIERGGEKKSYLITVQELVAAFRSFERQISEGRREIVLPLGQDKVPLPLSDKVIYAAVLEGMKRVLESWRRSRFGLQSN